MSDYRIINDNGYERTWEELYEDNVRFQKYTDKLEKENQELKEELEKEYNKGYERGILDTVEENQRLDKENQELKKQLEEYKRLGFKHLNDKCNKLEKQLEDKEDFITKLQATKDKLDKWDRENYYQQKEFIDWLEENYKNTQDIWYIKVLNKYKEIIGVSNENNKQ